MASEPLVSVIIPTYNRSAMVMEAVASVLRQTYRPFECIVADDGSSDNTSAELQKDFAGKIRLLRQENRGVSAARNLGIRESRGGYIAFLDSDDVWLPEKLSRQMAFFKHAPSMLICQTTERWMRKGKRVNAPETHRKKGGDIFQASLERCMITPSSVIVKRLLLDQVGLFDEQMPVCEDYDLWLRVTRQYPVGLIQEDLLIRNGGRPDQLSASHSLDKYRIRALEKLLESDALTPEQRKAAEAVFAEKCAIYAKGCLKRGREEEGRHYLLLAETMGAAR